MKRVLSILFVLLMLVQISISALANQDFVVSYTEGGTVSVLSDTDSLKTVQATPDEGYKFSYWTFTTAGGGSATSTNNPETFDKYPEETRTVRAVFEALPVVVQKNVVSASVDPAGSGTVNGSPSVSIEHTYTADDPVISITALPAAGYIFDGWYEGGSRISTSVSEIFDADRSRTLVAKFTASNTNPDPVNPNPVNPDPITQDPVNPSPLTRYTITYMPGKYSSGSTYSTEWYAGQVNLLGQTYARTGYTQTGWTEDGIVKRFNLNAVINLDRNLTLYPYWESVSVPLTLTLDIGMGGVVQLNGTNVPNGWSGVLKPNTSFTFYFYPAPNCYVYRLGLAGWHYPVQAHNSFTVTYEMMVGKNQTLQIRFADARSHPPTGDDSNIALWCILGAFSAAASAIVMLKKKRG